MREVGYMRGSWLLNKRTAVLLLPLFFSPTESLASFGINFGSWSVSNGVIATDVPCPPNAISCDAPIIDNGFYMRRVVLPSDQIHPSGTRPIAVYQYIMTDPGATGDPTLDASDPNGLRFVNETFSKGSSVQQGSMEQHTQIAQSWLTPGNIEERWSQVADVQTGYRTGPTNVTLDLGFIASFDQRLRSIDWTNPGAPVELVNIRFKGEGIAGSQGTIPAFKIAMEEDINLGAGVQKTVWLRNASNTNASMWFWTGQLVDTGDTAGLTPFSISYNEAGSLSANRVFTANLTFPQGRDISFTSANPVAINSVWPASLYPVVNLPAGHIFDLGPGMLDIYSAPAAITPLNWTFPAPDFVDPLFVNVATPLIGGLGTGGPPIDLGSWTVSNGIVTTTVDCAAAGLTCGTALVEKGLYQREIVDDATGQRYFQQIVTNNNSSGDPHVAPIYTPSGSSGAFNAGALDFASESFVSPKLVGIANRTQFIEATPIWSEPITGIGGTFNPVVVKRTPIIYSAKLNNGWAEGSGAAPVLDIKQVVAFEGGVAVNSTRPTFVGMPLGTEFDMTVAANGAKDYTVVSYAERNQALYMRQIEGGVQNSAHNGVTDPLLIAGGTNGGNIDWAVGDSIQAVWTGAHYGVYFGGGNSFGSDTPPKVDLETISFANLTTGARTSGSIIDTGVSYPMSVWTNTPFASPTPPTMTLPITSGAGTLTWPGQDLSW